MARGSWAATARAKVATAATALCWLVATSGVAQGASAATGRGPLDAADGGHSPGAASDGGSADAAHRGGSSGADDDGVSEEEMRQIAAGLSSDAADRVGIVMPPAAALPAASPAGRILQSMNPDLSLILDVAVGGSSRAADGQLGRGAHDPHHNGFTLQQLELFTSANVDPYLHFDATLVFTPDHIEIEEAFATTLALPANLQLRAGQFLTRFGRLNPTHPHQWHFLNQPLVLQKFMGAEGNRGLGIEASWLSPLPWYLETVLSATDAGGGHHGGETAASFLADLEPLPGIGGPGDPLYTLAIKQFFALHPDLSLLWGMSGQTGPNRRLGRSVIAGTDLYLRFRPLSSPSRQSLSLQLEAMWRQRDWPGAHRRDAGGYLEAVWGINPAWEAGLRGEWTSKIVDDFGDLESEAADDDSHHHHHHPTAASVSWPGARHRYLAQVTYSPSHFSRLRLQGHIDCPSWRPELIYGLFLALEVAVGAHGAHTY